MALLQIGIVHWSSYINFSIGDHMGIWYYMLTHWGRVTHICVGKLIIIGSDNGLSPDRRQAIIWTNAGLMSIGPMRTYFSENTTIFIEEIARENVVREMASILSQPQCVKGDEVVVFTCFIDKTMFSFLHRWVTHCSTDHLDICTYFQPCHWLKYCVMLLWIWLFRA